MLDAALLEQLKGLFAQLGKRIDLLLDASEHSKQSELLKMLEGIASTSDHIQLRESGKQSAVPHFKIAVEGEETGIAFRGIPGGHEFSSLVLAILNAAGKGKLPDAGLVQRIKRLPAKVELRTYISLSCENCPDVVQALNQIVLAHGAMKHTMIDGGLAQEELDRYGIQGVPTVMIGAELISSGRSNLAELLGKLESKLGQSAAAPEPQQLDLGHFDVVVVGGGPAGVSAAIYSVRKGLRTALIAEKIGGQVQETKGIENLISVIYTEGPQLSAGYDQHLRSYPVSILEHRRVLSISEEPAPRLQLDSGETLSCTSLIIATGAKWRELGVPGEKEYIGRGVAFCPHCDGPYYKGKRVAVIGGGNSGVEAAIDLAGICKEVVLFEYLDQLKADQVLVDKLRSLPNVSVVTNAKTSGVRGNGEKVVGLSYEDRNSGSAQQIDLDGVFVQIGLSPNSAIVKDLVELNKFGEIVVDPKGRTSRPGIYAAGDVTTVPFKQIVIAMGEGAKVALTAFEDRMRKASAS